MLNNKRILQIKVELKSILKEGFYFASLGMLIFLVIGVSLMTLLDIYEILNNVSVTIVGIIIAIFIVIADDKWTHTNKKIINSLRIILDLKKEK